MSTADRLDAAFADAPVLPLGSDSRYVLFSDCHRGTGMSYDNFLKNQNLYFAALRYYYDRQFTYIELGDGDELWENRSMEQIKSIHDNTFWLLSLYYKQKRLWLLYGNHDLIKRNPQYSGQHFSSYICSTNKTQPLFPGITFYEGLILKDLLGKRDLYLTHGHQADFLNSVLWKFSRFLVRYIWKPMEHIGFLDPTSAAKNNTKKWKTERLLTGWAIDNDRILISGHTHRPMIGTKESPYFNTGSCVHPRCITCIEVTDRCMTLVKWTLRTRDDMTLYVGREELAGPVCIDEY
ncbi:metallophosphoesterase [Extibacter muris]|uniref:Serine/threonine protein phosphatase n=1 Tax=Extibacter muris TaxID=1796622 RepID=A0A4R4FD14_9FIRM|nr:metallophosphoesterase [Extibacter muris]MCU0080637.1 serine/threonine protein phosphatase [Extibacter muris]TDA20593.1 serine/threonine protein phosphatase [Extibacter muris]